MLATAGTKRRLQAATSSFRDPALDETHGLSRHSLIDVSCDRRDSMAEALPPSRVAPTMLDQKRKPDRFAAQRAALEESILGAAEIEFADKGFEGATTSAIAARAGLPKANLHYYFPTKEALYRRIIGSVLTAWLDAAEVFDRGDSAQSALRRYIEAKMDLARERPLGSRIFAREVMRGAPAIQDFLDTTLTEWVRSRSAIVEGWIAAGELRPIDPKALFYMIWAATQHYADFAHQIATLNGGAPLDDDAFAKAREQVVTTLLRGVAADPCGSGQRPAPRPSTALRRTRTKP